MEIYFSVGEPSGDEHAAELIQELRQRLPDCRCVGLGGERMQQAGCEIHFPLTTMAVMGIVKVLPLIRKFWNIAQQARRYFREHKPDAVILVDFPGFNWWIAYYAKKEGIPVYYYMPPQLWAWGSWRVKRMHRSVDHVLSGLQFETDWYRQQGVEATFVGHPFFEEVSRHPVSEDQQIALRSKASQLIGILPGSRTMEVTMNWPAILRTAQNVARQNPDCRFVVANYKEHHREYCQKYLQEQQIELPLDFHVGQTSEIIAAADCCIMVSGSVSLELLARKTPAVVIYKAGWVMGTLAKYLIRCKYMSLPNLICHRELMPEFPYKVGMDESSVVQKMSEIVNGWLQDPERLTAKREEMRQVAEPLVSSQASVKSAEYLLSSLQASSEQKQAA